MSARHLGGPSLNPIKSASDYREYRIVVLDNGIKTLLISDIKPNPEVLSDGKSSDVDETRAAAAALYVAAGSFLEPENIGGLAHFLEHMLFMGSKKFPDENAYDSYLKMHGGSSNAYTTDESTVFYFDVQPEYFDGALDMFANFFISPLLTEDAVDREVKAVDSEFKGRIPDDEWRTDQVLRAFARDDHPYSRFTHGNKKSLVTLPKEKKIDVMGALQLFFEKHYNTRQMTLSLCSPTPLDELEAMTRKHFSGIKPRSNVKLLHNIELEDPFKPDQFHKLFLIAPVEEIHSVRLSWLIPPQQRHYHKKPADYISWLLTHECKGSVYAALKEKGFICSFDAYCSSDFTAFSQFYITTELTEKGIENIDVVIQTIFQYLTMMQKKGASWEVYEQLMKISENIFRYQEPEEPCSLVELLVDQMNYYHEEDYLTGSSVFSEFDPALIEELQNMLTTDKVNIMVLSKNYKKECDKVEPWFKSKYHVREIPPEWISVEKCKCVNNKLHFPAYNPYIPEKFDIHPINLLTYSEYPEIIQSDDKGKVWYKGDRKFLLPKADLNFMLLTPVAQESSFNLMCANMLDYILDFELEEICCEASICELDMSQSSDGKCHSIYFSGFSDKLIDLFKDVMDFMSNYDFSENGFSVSKEQMERDYRNALIKSDGLNRTLKNLVMRSHVTSPIESLQQLVDLTPPVLKKYYKEYFSQIYIESLFQGNITREQVNEFLSYMYSTFNFNVLEPKKFPEIRTLSLPNGRTVCRHNVFGKEDPNSVIHNHYEIGPPSLRMHNVAALLQHLMEEPLFNILRTKQQLGYTVYCSCEYSEGGILGYSITVETDSNKYNADEIDKRIEQFLRTFYEMLKKEIDYNKFVDSYIKLLKQADLSVNDEASRNWAEIYYQDYIFDRRYRSIQMAKQIEKSEVIAFLDKYLLKKENVKMISIQVIGYSEEGEREGEWEERNEAECEYYDDEGGYGGDDDDDDNDDDNDNVDDNHYNNNDDNHNDNWYDDDEDDDDDDDDDYDDDDDDYDNDDEDDLKDLHNCEITLVEVRSKQYTRSLKDIQSFRVECGFHPFSRILLE